MSGAISNENSIEFISYSPADPSSFGGTGLAGGGGTAGGGGGNAVSPVMFNTTRNLPASITDPYSGRIAPDQVVTIENSAGHLVITGNAGQILAQFAAVHA